MWRQGDDEVVAHYQPGQQLGHYFIKKFKNWEVTNLNGGRGYKETFIGDTRYIASPLCLI